MRGTKTLLLAAVLSVSLNSAISVAQSDTTAAGNISAAFDTPPEATLQVPPVYPPQALIDGVEGTVYLETRISARGRVEKVKVIKTEAEALNAAATAAVKQWRFTPAKKDGKAVAATVAIPVKFRLNKDGKQ